MDLVGVEPTPLGLKTRLAPTRPGPRERLGRERRTGEGRCRVPLRLQGFFLGDAALRVEQGASGEQQTGLKVCSDFSQAVAAGIDGALRLRAGREELGGERGVLFGAGDRVRAAQLSLLE